MMMHSFRLTISILFVQCLCIIVVYSKNVENVRAKRTISGFENNCENVKPFFQMRNISLPFGSNGTICGGQCCGNKTEALLRKQGQKDFATLLRHNSRSLQGLLSLTAATLQNHVSELSRQSENKTLLLFSQVYKGMAVLSKAPIAALYSNIRNYIQMNGSSQTDITTTTTITNQIDIKASVMEFFTEFFPLVYHHILLHNTANKDFTFDYKSCLKKTIDTVLPFGDIPKQLSQSLTKSLETTRLLLEAFRIGIEVLNTTDRLLIDENSKSNSDCHKGLLKMTYCPKCMGLTKHTKPCSGYCLNVLRGCLTKYVAELDSPWNGYVEGIESLVNAMKKNNADAGVNADLVIRGLDTRISEAIMRAMERGQDIDNKVKRNCGPATFSEKEDPLIAESSTPLPLLLPPTNGKPRLANPRVFAPLPETQLLNFLTSIAKTRGFYGNLADTLCQDESFAEPKDQRCWNGEQVAEYTKMVVDVGLNMQKYNPEVTPSTIVQTVDPSVADMVDKLRHVHHMAMSSVGSTTTDQVDYMQRDGVDGSGSGSGPDFEDGDDEYNPGSSGSGYGPNNEDNPRNFDHPNIKPTDIDSSFEKPTSHITTGGARATISASSSVLTYLVLYVFIVRLNCYYY